MRDTRVLLGVAATLFGLVACGDPPARPGAGAATDPSQVPLGAPAVPAAPPRAGPVPAAPSATSASGPAAVANVMGGAAFLSAGDDVAARDAALALLERAVAAAPEVARYRLDLADAYLRTRDETALALAVDLYEELLEDHPQDDVLLGRLAEAYGALGGHAQALELARRRLGLGAEPSEGALLQLAQLALEAGLPLAGCAIVEEACARAPAQPLAVLVLAALEVEGGRLEQARVRVQAVRPQLTDRPALARAAEGLLGRIDR